MTESIESRQEQNKSLYNRVVQGGVWIFALRLSGEILSLLRILVLARLLAPNDFGLMGITLLIAAILGKVLDTGFEAAIIQKKGEETEKYLNIAWTIQICRGILIALLLYTTAPLAAIFFNEPQVENILKVFSLTQFLSGFNNIGLIFLEKELLFKKEFKFRFIPKLIECALVIALALIYRSIWVLVLGSIIRAGFILWFSYLVQPYRPGLEFNLQKCRELFNFSKWVVGEGFVNFLLIQGDDFLVGKLLGAKAVGLYQMGYRLSNLPATEITHLITRVTFAAFSKMQDEKQRLKESYLRVLGMAALLSLPVAGLIFGLAADFTLVVLGDKWGSIIPVVQILALWGAFRALDACVQPLCRAVGKPKIVFQLQFCKLILVAILIYPLTKKYGIVGTSWVITGSAIAISPILHFLVSRILDCSLVKLIKTIFLPLLAAICLNLSLWVVNSFLLLAPSLWLLVGKAVIAVLVYMAVIVVLDKLFKGDNCLVVKQLYASLIKRKN